MGRIGTVRPLAAFAIAAGAAFLLPVTAGATSNPGRGNVIAPVGHVAATLLLPGPHQKPSRQPKPFRARDDAALHAAKLNATAAPLAPAASPAAAPAAAAVFNGLNMPGLSAADQGNQPTPPDSTGAIGPTRYVEMVNQLVGVFDRSNLTRLSSTDLGTLRAPPRAWQRVIRRSSGMLRATGGCTERSPSTRV